MKYYNVYHPLAEAEISAIITVDAFIIMMMIFAVSNNKYSI